ncbi:class I SAM-dependent methyltransferase [uncultured Algoriphagus sp.]|uniref:O-methyltransferase n=1 Tax=uncultured Algoriphagus sp. TaxID=417365 RepID=UPI0030EED0BB|tara:strand:- start:52700 stop:53281 length:582 start_codon:yes stop_codon:yes gene_type:complete
MKQSDIRIKPASHPSIEAKCQEIGFTMPSDLYIGTLLKTLIASKPAGNFLELGTGIGLSLSWMVDGLDKFGKIISIDNDPELTGIVSAIFEQDPRVKILCQDGAEFIKTFEGDKFDLIFADAWPGKYSELDETLSMLKVGGMYVIDDMDPQPNWPEGHAEKAKILVELLENRTDFTLTKMNWSTGIILMTKLK